MRMCARLWRLKVNSMPGNHGHTSGAIRISLVVVFWCPFFLLRKGFLLNVGLTDLARLGGQKVPGIHAPSFSAKGCKEDPLCLAFLSQCWRWDSGFHDCPARTLLIGPSQ